jgi:hypothetical protein
MLSIIGDDGNRLSIITSQHTEQVWTAPGLKGDTISDLELQHLAVCTLLIQEAKALHDSMIEVDQFCLGEFIDIDLHVFASPIPIIKSVIPDLIRNPLPTGRQALSRE